MDYVNNQYDHYLIEQINISIDTGNITFIEEALKCECHYTKEIKNMANSIKLELLTENIECLMFK